MSITALARARRGATTTNLGSATEKIRLADQLESSARILEDTRRTKIAAEAAFTEAEGNYLELAFRAKAAGVKVRQVEFTASNGLPMSATLVDGTGKKTELDVAKLQKKLGALRWRKVTRPVLDKDLLDQAVDKGIVKPTEVAACMAVGDKKSYASFSVRTKDIVDSTVVPTTARRVRKSRP